MIKNLTLVCAMGMGLLGLDLTASEAVGLIRQRKITPVELTQACLARIGKLNPRLNAFITVLRDPSESTLPAARFEKTLRQLVEERLAAEDAQEAA